MLFVLAGPSYVGKKTVMMHFIKLYSFSSIIPYTTKPMRRRNGEVEGIKYHYVEKENESDIKNDEYIFDCPFDCEEQRDEVIYAYKKRDIEQAIDSYSNFIIHASVGNAIQIYEEYYNDYKEHLHVIFLNYSTKLDREMFKEKYIRIGLGNRLTDKNDIEKEDFDRRYNHARKEIKIYTQNKRKFNICIEADQPYNACEKVQEYVLPNLIVMPTSPDRIPGPLSDDDILYMVEHRKNDNLRIRIENKSLSKDELIAKMSGCGINLSLSGTIRKATQRTVNNYIDMAADECELKKVLAKAYPEESISTGYILKPNEVILCSTNEILEIPHDVYGVVAANFSYTQLGLSIELGTSIVQGGHRGKIHFQIKNNTNNGLCIYPNIKVIQLLLFRTVQPASKPYRDYPNNNCYDEESISPISKFYQKDNNLKDAKKPGNNAIKSFLALLHNELLEKFIGVLTTGIVLFRFWKEASLLSKEIAGIFTGGSILWKVFILSVLVFIFEILFDIIGKIVLSLFHKAYWIIRDAVR